MIKKIRQALKLTQEGLAKRIDVSTHTIQSWEQGKRNPNKWVWKKIQEIAREHLQDNFKEADWKVTWNYDTVYYYEGDRLNSSRKELPNVYYCELDSLDYTQILTLDQLTDIYQEQTL